jgi:hypothetical protein
MSTPMHALKRRLPPSVLAVVTGIGAAIGYVFVRSEADRLADQLNASIVESMAYVDRRLDDLDARIGRARPELGFVIAALAGLEAGSIVRLEVEFEDVSDRLRWLGYQVSADAQAPSAVVIADARRIPPATSGTRLVVASEGPRRTRQQWTRSLHGWELDSFRQLALDRTCGWRPATDGDHHVLTLLSARA